MLVLWTGGCATAKVNWAARVGSYTYDQAVREYGPPDRSAELSDKTKVCEWLLQRGFPIESPVYAGRGRWARGYGYSTAGPDWFLRLTFAPDGKLTESKELAR